MFVCCASGLSLLKTSFWNAIHRIWANNLEKPVLKSRLIFSKQSLKGTWWLLDLEKIYQYYYEILYCGIKSQLFLRLSGEKYMATGFLKELMEIWRMAHSHGKTELQHPLIVCDFGWHCDQSWKVHIIQIKDQNPTCDRCECPGGDIIFSSQLFRTIGMT